MVSDLQLFERQRVHRTEVVHMRDQAILVVIGNVLYALSARFLLFCLHKLGSIQCSWKLDSLISNVYRFSIFFFEVVVFIGLSSTWERWKLLKTTSRIRDCVTWTHRCHTLLLLRRPINIIVLKVSPTILAFATGQYSKTMLGWIINFFISCSRWLGRQFWKFNPDAHRVTFAVNAFLCDLGDCVAICDELRIFVCCDTLCSANSGTSPSFFFMKGYFCDSQRRVLILKIIALFQLWWWFPVELIYYVLLGCFLIVFSDCFVDIAAHAGHVFRGH